MVHRRVSGGVRGTVRKPLSNVMSRRKFIGLGGAVAGATMLGAGCGGGDSGGSGGVSQLTFSLFPDPTGTVQELIDRFNADHEGEIEVSFREMAADSGQHFDTIRTELQSGQSEIDIIGGDVVWPAQFAASGWISDLSDRFPESDRAAFLEAPIQANTYEGSIYGIPWYTDAGLLYYRRDLLEAAGISEPPATYDELREMAQEIRDRNDLPHGFVFQGADYEGGVVNGLEYIWNSGGDVLDGNEVVIDSPEAISGLETERAMVADGISPRGVSQYKEQESATLFLRGERVHAERAPHVRARERPERVEHRPGADRGRGASGGGFGHHLYEFYGRLEYVHQLSDRGSGRRVGVHKLHDRRPSAEVPRPRRECPPDPCRALRGLGSPGQSGDSEAR